MTSNPTDQQRPGRELNADDVLAAYADPRDWFTYEERLRALLEITFACRSAAGDASDDWEPAVILFLGSMGSGTSALMAHEAARWYRLGHPFFHGGGFTFGRRLMALDLLDWHHRVPYRSVVCVEGLEFFDDVQLLALKQRGCRVLLRLPPYMLSRAARKEVTEVRESSRRDSRFEADEPILAYRRACPPRLDISTALLRQGSGRPPFDQTAHRITGAEALEALLLTATFQALKKEG